MRSRTGCPGSRNTCSRSARTTARVSCSWGTGSVRQRRNVQVVDLGLVQRPVDAAGTARVVREVLQVAHVETVLQRERAARLAGGAEAAMGGWLGGHAVRHHQRHALRVAAIAVDEQPFHRRGDAGVDRAVGVAVIRPHAIDRKSTRLNSSHVEISYAVFCLKKKTKNKDDM